MPINEVWLRSALEAINDKRNSEMNSGPSDSVSEEENDEVQQIRL